MRQRLFGYVRPLALAVAAAAMVLGAGTPRVEAQSGTLQVAVLQDMTNFDPMQFSTVNFFLIKNLYDSLIEYTEDGTAVPSLASAWEIGADNASVTLTLRDDVKFASGGAFTAADVAATWTKAMDPTAGKNVFPTMAIVEDWVVNGDHSITLNFKNPVPDRQILDLLQFSMPIEAAGIATVETQPAGTGAYRLKERQVGQRIVLEANPDYWRDGEPKMAEVDFTIFSDDASAAAALESGAVDMTYMGQSRTAARLQNAGFQVIAGPGKLVQVFRINSTRAPFDNASFRQAFNHLMNREGILRVGYAGLGEVTALPWAPASPATDKSFNDEFAYDIAKAKEFLAGSSLSAAAMSDWKLLVNGSDEASVAISQIVQGSLTEAGIAIELDIRQGAEFIDALLGGDFHAVFGGVGNVQKFPSRVATNSIYRTAKNPVFGDPHPHPRYVDAITRVDTTIGSPDEVKASYDNLNRVLVEEAFAIPTNSYETGLIVAASNVEGFILDMDNLFVARGLSLR
jgi:peptide/nickel transport system substrate-binding protein